jgi:hypothetical protein
MENGAEDDSDEVLAEPARPVRIVVHIAWSIWVFNFLVLGEVNIFPWR